MIEWFVIYLAAIAILVGLATLVTAYRRQYFRHYVTQQHWSFFRDLCEVEGCERRGVLGNENIVKGMIVCDDCHARSLAGYELKLRRVKWHAE